MLGLLSSNLMFGEFGEILRSKIKNVHACSFSTYEGLYVWIIKNTFSPHVIFFAELPLVVNAQLSSYRRKKLRNR